MPLIILGIFFGIALIIYYLVKSMLSSDYPKPEDHKYKQSGNVIFLPSDIEKEKKRWKHTNK